MQRLKVWFYFLAFIAITRTYADFEDCHLIEESDIKDSINVSIPSPDGKSTIKIELVEDKNSKGVLKSKEDSEGYFTGFMCKEQKENKNESSDLLEPCKQYIHFTESQSEYFSDSLLCFRSFDNATQKTSTLIVLNKVRRDEINIFLKLAETNSYIQDSRFLFSVTKFMTETLNDIVPILDHTNPLFWLRPENLIVENSSDGRMYFRYRYIDTNVLDKTSREQKQKAIHSIFFMLKLFMFKNKSCKEIVEQMRSTFYFNAFSLDPTYPKNFQVVHEWLNSQECQVKDDLALTTNEKHEIMLRLAAVAYCRKKVAYDLESLKALKEMIGFIFNEDQIFLSFAAQSKFKATFQKESTGLIPEIYAPSDLIAKAPSHITEAIKSITEEPLLDKVNHP